MICFPFSKVYTIRSGTFNRRLRPTNKRNNAMRTKFFIGTTLAIPLLALLAWSPWLTVTFAKARAVDSFNKSWTSVIDGCGTNCKGCGAIEAQRVPFGVKVTLEYGCGLM